MVLDDGDVGAHVGEPDQVAESGMVAVPGEHRRVTGVERPNDGVVVVQGLARLPCRR